MQQSSGHLDGQIQRASRVGTIGLLSNPEMLYPSPYTWLLLFSALDIICTWVVLSAGGWEVNPIADIVIHTWGLPGATLFKFCLVLLSIIICEAIGRMNRRTGRRVVLVMVSIASIPVWWSLLLLWMARDSLTTLATTPPM